MEKGEEEMCLLTVTSYGTDGFLQHLFRDNVLILSSHSFVDFHTHTTETQIPKHGQ